MKVITIEEAQDIIIIKVDKLIGSRITYEIAINEILDKRNKGVVFKVHVENNEEQVEKDTIDNLSNSIALIAKIFGNIMRRLDKRSKNNVKKNVKDKLPDNSRSFTPSSTKARKDTN